MDSRPARTIVHHLVQRRVLPAAPLLTYSEIPTSGSMPKHYCCLLKCQAPEEAREREELSFEGTGTSKKAAHEEAAQLLLDALRSKFPGINSESSVAPAEPRALTPTVKRLLSDQGLPRDAPMLSYVLFSQSAGQTRWIPVGALLSNHGIMAWVKQQKPAGSSAALELSDALRLLHEGLLQEREAIEADGCIKLSDDCRRIRRQDPFKRTADAANQPVPADSFTAVLLPADVSDPPREVQVCLSPDISLWQALGAALGVGPADVVPLTKLGKSKGSKGVNEEEPQEGQAMAAARGGAAAAGASSDPLRPYLYCTWPGEAALPPNPRASWLKGEPLRGPVLLAGVYCQRAEPLGRLQAAPYGLQQLLTCAGTLAPEGAYAALTKGGLLMRLPQRYMADKQWQGPKPCTMLSDYACRRLAGSAQLTYATRDDADSGAAAQPAATGAAVQPAFFAAVALPALPGGDAISASAGPSRTEDLAKQQAALTLLHALQRAVAAAFVAAPCGASGPGAEPGVAAAADAASDVVVEQRSSAGTLAATKGQLVHLKYSLHQLDTTADAVVGFCKVVCGAQGLPAQLEPLLHGLRAGDMFSAALALPLGPAALLGAAAGHAGTPAAAAQVRVAAKVVKVEEAPPLPGHQQLGLFDPPLHLQRYEAVARLIASHGARSVLDVGCGDGRLLQHLQEAALRGGAPALRLLSGMDLSLAALQGASKRLQEGGSAVRLVQALDAADVGGGASATPAAPGAPADSRAGGAAGAASASGDADAALAVTLVHGDLTEAAAGAPWLAALGCIDAVTCVEVVEHLDPQPLAALGPLLLARLSPRMALVTTPNSEYNCVMSSLGGRMLPSGLRNSDHRFEWTRCEFAAWCDRLAAEHGYRVQVQQLGRAVREQEVLSALQGSGDLGGATQVAIFTKLEPGDAAAVVPATAQVAAAVPPATAATPALSAIAAVTAAAQEAQAEAAASAAPGTALLQATPLAAALTAAPVASPAEAASAGAAPKPAAPLKEAAAAALQVPSLPATAYEGPAPAATLAPSAAAPAQTADARSASDDDMPPLED